MPNQNTLMAKRAYYAAQTIVSEMINEESCYPDKTMASEDEQRVGFDDGYGYANCDTWNDDYIESEGDASEKFETIFRNKLADSTNISWNISADVFDTNKNDSSQYATIIVDVNGIAKPNQACSKAGGGSGECSDGTDYDRFALRIYEDGKVEIDPEDTWAIEAVDVNKNITE
jgi:hypothetical protein